MTNTNNELENTIKINDDIASSDDNNVMIICTNFTYEEAEKNGFCHQGDICPNRDCKFKR